MHKEVAGGASAGVDDPHLRILQAAHIEDDEYFSHMIQDDISVIVRDIRAAHKSDSESSPPKN